MDKNRQIEKITDLFDKSDFYISQIRQGDSRQALTGLLSGVLAWLDRFKSDSKAMETLAFIFADEIYRYAASSEMADDYTYLYYESLMQEFLKTFNEIGIYLFYILDNNIRQDRFDFAIQLYKLTGFSVVAPYFDNIDQSLVQDVPDKSVKIVLDPPHQYEYCNYQLVDVQLKNHIEAKRNVIYIEKDDRINYIDKVMSVAKDSGYLTVFRNLAPAQSEIQVFNRNVIG